MAEQEDHSDQVQTQSVAGGVQSRVSGVDGHASPPYMGSFDVAHCRDCVDVSLSQSLQVDHAPSQSAGSQASYSGEVGQAAPFPLGCCVMVAVLVLR